MNLNYRQLEGETLDEYALNSLIGTGGMSAVYRAYHDELDRYVAVKVLSSESPMPAMTTNAMMAKRSWIRSRLTTTSPV